MVGYRENPVAPLPLHFQPSTLKKLYYAHIIKGGIGAVHKLGIPDHIIKESILIAGIGQVTPALTRDIDLLTEFFILFN